MAGVMTLCGVDIAMSKNKVYFDSFNSGVSINAEYHHNDSKNECVDNGVDEIALEYELKKDMKNKDRKPQKIRKLKLGRNSAKNVVNNVDGLIEETIKKMNKAVEEDRKLVRSSQKAIHMVSLLPNLRNLFKTLVPIESWIKLNILFTMACWLTSLHQKTLPDVKVRSFVLKTLMQFPWVSKDEIETSGLGLAVKDLSKNPKEIGINKHMCRVILRKWLK